MKIKNIGSGQWIHYCPGCKQTHAFWTHGSITWDFNGDTNSPTVNPSLKHSWGNYNPATKERTSVEYVCHYFIHDGKIKFCPDSTHEFSSQVVDLPSVDQFEY